MPPNSALQSHLPALLASSTQPDRLQTQFDAFCELVEREGVASSDVLETIEICKRSVEPEELLHCVLNLAQNAEGRSSLSVAGVLPVFVTLASQGSYPARALLRHPDDLIYLATNARHDLSWGVEAMVTILLKDIEQSSEPGEPRKDVVARALRRFKRRESLRIYLREVEGLASVRQTTAEIADLAQACLEVAVVEGAADLGDASLANDFCVLGMGKLGGRELNYSSDVDLIYICTDTVTDDATRRRQIDALARWVTAALDAATADGYVFRVDLRLRPEGDLGPLVQPVSAMISYYLQWGRTWERSAMLKARAVAGDPAIGAALTQALEPFLFRKYLDYAVIDDLRSMKQMVNDNAQLSAIVGLPE
ncbi:MAG: hypothetical protein H0U74_18100, partial [Bradymonadaceae bacterium]|nr:hypothetical protein [Lujinxingiaceae bacterium]